MGEEEYEVESIIQARVEKKRGKKLAWKYCVRWKGYGPNDDTWEPVESFEGSEEIIQRFWERANTNGRDYHDLSLFTSGEEFVPMGPPPRKRKSLVANAAETPRAESSSRLENEPITDGDKRKRSISPLGISEDRPNKRVRDRTVKPAPPPRKDSRKASLPGRSPDITSRPRHPDSVVPFSGSPRLQRNKVTRAPSFDEIIPASDEENDEISLRNVHNSVNEESTQPDQTIVTQELYSSKGSTSRSDAIRSSPTTNTHNLTMDTRSPSFTNEPDLLFDDMNEGPSVNLPSHRARIANPLVKMIETSNIGDMGGAIPIKARLLANRTAHKHTGSKPGPGRSSSGFISQRPPKNTSSVLRFEKGSLKTVKGKYKKTKERSALEVEADQVSDHDDGSLFGDEGSYSKDTPEPVNQISAPPTAEELLKLAGLDQNTENLPDFEDEPTNSTSNPPPMPLQSKNTSESQQILEPEVTLEPPTMIHAQSEQAKSTLQRNLDLAKDKLFPSGETTTNISSTPWKRPTIFGPLGLGSETQASPMANNTPSKSMHSVPFSLNLDSSVSIPIVLTNAPPSSSGSSSFDHIVGQGGPSGKFYSEQAALSLLNTLRTGRLSAIAVPDSVATDDQKQNFRHFQARLKSGELFVAVAGAVVLAFCSSDNILISQRLNLSPSVHRQSVDVLVSEVTIENYSAYADAALGADNRRWPQYLLTL